MSDTPHDQPAVVAQLWHSVRWLLPIAGGVAVGTALLVAIFPPAARLIPVAAVVAFFGSDYIVVAAIGGVAIGCGLILIGARLWRQQTETTPPVVETVQSAIHPGTTLDQTDGQSLATADSNPRPQLRAAAIAATAAAECCSKQEATTRVANGSWTTDQVASAWLGADSATSAATDGGIEAASEQTVKRTTQAITEKASQSVEESAETSAEASAEAATNGARR